MTDRNNSQSRASAFVHYLFDRCQHDKGFAARIRRADNPATEYQSWEALAVFGVDLENSAERLSFGMVAAAVARSRFEINGILPLGRAIALCYDDGNQSDPAKTRLRRLLACDNNEELCRVLRPLLTLIQSRIAQPLDYAQLLSDALWFNRSQQNVKAHWAQQFYGKQDSMVKESL